MRRAGSASAPLRWYGLLELLIGVSAFAAPATLDWGYALLRDSGGGLAWGSGYYYLASGAWVTLALLPWCTCMGATFPFAMAAIRRRSVGASEHSFSFLYLANVLGAIAGTLVPAFVLIELFGFYGTLRIAAVMNGLLAASVFLVSFSAREAATAATETQSARKVAPASARSNLWLLFTTGLCSMAMEVIWMREFTVYLGNVVYAFASILAMYLAATFTGSIIYRQRMERGAARGDVAWIALGLASLLPLLFADPRFPLPEAQYTLEGFLYGAVRACLGVILFSGFAGFVTPMLVDEWSAGDPDRAGHAYAVNVVGSILGPLVSGFLVLPWAGEHWGLCIVTLPLFLAGFAKSFGTGRRKPLFAVCAIVSIALLAFTKDYGSKFPHRMELRDYAATVIATGEGMDKRLLVNGTGMTVLTPITKVMAHLPLTLLGRPADKALVICFGMGTTFRSMMSWDLPSTTAVELIPSVPKLFGYYHSDGPQLLEKPNGHVTIDDGRRFLERSGDQYDVIVVDPPPPVSAPTSGLLYSRQIYTIMKAHLKPDGIVQVWFPGDNDDATLASIARAFRDAFPYVRTFESIEGWGIHFLGRMQPFPYPTGAELASRLPARAAADLVEWQHGEASAAMLDRVLAGEKKVDELIAADPSVPGISDERPINEYFLLRAMRGEE
jgi:predicted membrane-bound spermidine synthase